jgi:hypothetical protein
LKTNKKKPDNRIFAPSIDVPSRFCKKPQKKSFKNVFLYIAVCCLFPTFVVEMNFFIAQDEDDGKSASVDNQRLNVWSSRASLKEECSSIIGTSTSPSLLCFDPIDVPPESKLVWYSSVTYYYFLLIIDVICSNYSIAI